MWALVYIPTALLPIQFLANGQGGQQRMALAGPYHPHRRSGRNSWHLALAWPSFVASRGAGEIVDCREETELLGRVQETYLPPYTTL